MKKLTKTQQAALKKIEQSGGHGVGPYSFIRSSTARVLARLGLVVLGSRRLPGEDRPVEWAIATGSEEPYGFVSYEEERRQWAEVSNRVKARRAAQRHANSNRIERVIAVAREQRSALGKPSDAAWEIEARRILQNETNLENAENHLGLAE